jgi:hypothetical protein
MTQLVVFGNREQARLMTKLEASMSRHPILSKENRDKRKRQQRASEA